MRFYTYKSIFFYVVLPSLPWMCVLGGCGPAARKPLRICPGISDVEQTVSILKAQARNVESIRATGQCRLQYYTEDKGPYRENFPVRLWMESPGRVCLYGDVAFDARGITLGCNQREFWLSIKPGAESYWWGRWPENKGLGKNCFEQFILNPKTLLEAIGVVPMDSVDGQRSKWMLSNEGPFDILTRLNGDGNIVKKIYVYSCDYLVRKIEYFDSNGQVSIVTELDDYKQISDGFSVPALIKIVRFGHNGRDDSIRIKLKSIKPVGISEKRQRILFSRPEPRGVKHIYELNENCELIEQRR